MLKFIATVLAITSSLALAKEDKKCNTKFTNPIVDARIDFTRCAVSGALIGILDEDYGDVLCMGSLRFDRSRTIYVFKGAQSSKLVYFEETESKLVSAIGGQEGGERVYKAKIVTLGKDLGRSKKAKRATLKYVENWEYSEGGMSVSGSLPNARAKFNAPVFFLEQLQEELDNFASEVCHKN